MGNVMYGHELSKSIRETMQLEIQEYVNKGYRKPSLAIVVVGNDSGSHSYVISIMKACANIGIDTVKYEFEDSVSQETLVNTINLLNNNSEIDGIIIQMPLPKHIDTNALIECMDPKKDVDGLTSTNVAKLYSKQKGMLPCTPKAVMRMLKEYKVELSGKEVVVIGRSPSVGRPVAQLLLNENATVTVCHSYSKNIANISKRAEVLVVAVGKARFVKQDWISDGTVVVDVGVNMDDKGKLCGDVDFDAILDKASLVTPVPKGVGPVTTTMLLENVLESYRERVLLWNTI